ncbi:MAG: MFS transporter [Acidobacteria bacterium]|nr:MFS transporter [Acidobacteriota bacterium]
MLIDITPLKISRDYRLLFFGQLISFFGSMMSFVVVPVQMYQLTKSSLAVGLLGVAEFLPMLVLAFVGGALADAVDRRKMLRLTEIAQTIVTTILLINSLLPNPQIWVLYVAVGLHAGLVSLQRPSFEALIPRILPPEQMPAVSALNSIRYNIGLIAAPAIAGLIVARLGAQVAYSIDLFTFIASLLAVFLISAVPPALEAVRPSWQSIKQGLKYALSRKELLGTYLIDINAMFFGMPMALFPALAASYGGASVGLFYSAPAVGSLFATLTSGWTKRINRHGLAIAVAAGLWGVSIIIFGLMNNLWLALFFLSLAGAFDMISGIFRSTVWNQTIPNHLRGRLAGIEMVSYLTGPMLGNAEAGVVASLYGLRTSVVSGGIFTVAGTLALAFLLPQFIKYDGREGIRQKLREEKERDERITIQNTAKT